MIRFVALSFALVLLAGCATYSQVFINANGQMMQCSATGQGLIGMATASNAVSDCSSNMRAAGFLEIERAGVIGVLMAETPVGEPPRVLKVMDPSPAYYSGVDPGDLVIAVDGQEVRSNSEAKVLMFGEAGTEVAVHFRRGDFDTTVVLVRAPYRSVFGQRPPVQSIH